jgi:hypothetical protein
MIFWLLGTLVAYLIRGTQDSSIYQTPDGRFHETGRWSHAGTVLRGLGIGLLIDIILIALFLAGAAA